MLSPNLCGVQTSLILSFEDRALGAPKLAKVKQILKMGSVGVAFDFA